MKKATGLLLTETIAVVVLLAGCAFSPSLPESSPATGQTVRTIVITYTPALTLQLGSTNFLMVDMTIANKGYGSFDTSPTCFSILIDNGEYPIEPSLTDLKTVKLPDNDTLSGRLVFQVPPDIASHIETFRLNYSGIQPYNISWNEVLADTVADAMEPASANPVVLIKYSPTFVSQESGDFLVVNLNIENSGYDSFDTSMDNFFVVVNHNKYSCDVELSELRTFSIPYGGRINGKLTFQLPANTVSGETEYSLVYSGTELYNVQWFLMPTMSLR